MSNALTAFNPDFSIVFDVKGGTASLSIEGAIHKGGKALIALKDAAENSAVTKAINGRYTAAVDILSIAMPKAAKATEVAVGMPALNKRNFEVLLCSIARLPVPAKGWNKRQVAALHMASALRTALGIEEPEDNRTIDMVESKIVAAPAPF